jgi:hypothetical protein
VTSVGSTPPMNCWLLVGANVAPFCFSVYVWMPLRAMLPLKCVMKK